MHSLKDQLTKLLKNQPDNTELFVVFKAGTYFGIPHLKNNVFTLCRSNLEHIRVQSCPNTILKLGQLKTGFILRYCVKKWEHSIVDRIHFAKHCKFNLLWKNTSDCDRIERYFPYFIKGVAEVVGSRHNRTLCGRRD